MKLIASVGRRGVSLGLALAACMLLALPAQAKAASDGTLLATTELAAAQSTPASAKSMLNTPTASESAAALLVKQQATGAVAMADDRETPFPRGWMLGLLAVLVLVLCDRIRLSMKLAKLNEASGQSSALSAPFARN